jgi:hypothetical protein
VCPGGWSNFVIISDYGSPGTIFVSKSCDFFSCVFHEQKGWNSEFDGGQVFSCESSISQIVVDLITQGLGITIVKLTGVCEVEYVEHKDEDCLFVIAGWRQVDRKWHSDQIEWREMVRPKAEFEKAVEQSGFAGYNCRLPHEHSCVMVGDVKQLLDIGGGSWTVKWFSHQQQNSISGFGISVIDFSRRKIVGLGEKYLNDENEKEKEKEESGRVWIPATVVVLVKSCFEKWTRLESIVFENDSKLIQISESSFSRSGLKSIAIPSSVEILCKSCFESCASLESISFENNSKLTRIEESAFSRSGLKSIAIPSSVEILCKFCFGWCKSLESISFENDSKLNRMDQPIFIFCRLKSIIIPSSIESICRKSLGYLVRFLSVMDAASLTPAERCTFSFACDQDSQTPRPVAHVVGESRRLVKCHGLPPRVVETIRTELRRHQSDISTASLDEITIRLASAMNNT